MAKDKLKIKEKKQKNKLKIEKTSLYWVYFVFGAIIILLGIFFAPFWKEINADIPWANWYSYALGGLVAGAIFVYMFGVLAKKLKDKSINKTVRIIFGVEFAMLAFFAVCCIIKSILNDNEKFDFLNACEIIGLTIWVRGCVEMLNAYYYDKNSKQKYPVWYLAINIGFVTVGPLVFALGIIYRSTIDLIVSYSFCSIIFVLGVFCCVWGGLSKPIKIVEIPVEEQEVELVENIEKVELKDEPVDVENNKEIEELPNKTEE